MSAPENHPVPLKSQLVLFAVIFLLVAIAAVYALRTYAGDPAFGIPLPATLRIAGLALTMTLVLCWMPVAQSIGVLLSLGTLLVFTPKGLSPIVVDLSVGAALLAALASGKRSYAEPVIRPYAFVGIIAALLTVFLVASMNFGTSMADPLTLEKALLGLAHVDTLFHAAIAQQTTLSGYVSTGLDGAPEAAYHALSHRFVAGLSFWTNLHILQTYGLFVPLLGGPLLFVSFVRLWGALKLTPTTATTILLPIALVLFLGLKDWRSYLLSESYLVSLILSFWAILWITEGRSLLRWIGIAALIALVSMSKISVGAVLACLVAAAIVLQNRSWISAILVPLCAIVPFYFVFSMNRIALGDGEPIIGFFAYYNSYPSQALYHIFWTLVSTWAAVFLWPKGTDRRNIVLFLLVGVWAALLSSLIVNLPAGAAYYFGNPGIWFGILILGVTGWTPSLLLKLSPKCRVILCWIVLSFGVFNEDTLWVWPNHLAASATAIQGRDQQALSQTPFGRLYTAAQRLEHNGIYVQPSYTDLWTAQKLCWQSSLNIRALVQHPLVLGLPPVPCDITPFYGFTSYEASASRSIPLETDNDICTAAIARGVSRPLIVGPADIRIAVCE